MGFIAAFWSFIYSGEIIYDPPESDLFYDIYNILNEYNRRQTRYLSLIEIYFGICFWVNQKVFFITLSASSLIMTSMLNFFWMHYMLFVIIFARTKVICYCELNFQVSDFLRLFIMFFKYGLILLEYSSTNNVLFLSMLLSYSI